MDKTEAEKWEFLEALYQHGSNVKALHAALPSWTVGQIEYTIKRFRFRAKRKLESDKETTKEAALNQWLKVIEQLHQLQGTSNQPWYRKGRRKLTEAPKDHAPILSKTLMYAACFEDHYESSSPDDPNYSEIYRYLSQLIEGKEPTQLSPGSAEKVLEMVNKIKKVVTDESVTEHFQFLKNTELSYLPPTSSKPMRKANEKTKRKASNARAGATSPEPLCPLFQEDGEEVKGVTLETCDPYYELKKESVIRKVHNVQQEAASTIFNVPGLNPLEIPPKKLVKPSVAIVNPQNL